MMDDKQKKSTSSALKYAGLGSQLMVFMGLGAWGGYKLDERLGFKALFVIIFPVIALGYSLWQLVKTLSKK